MTNEKALAARIFYKKYCKVKKDPTYLLLRKKHELFEKSVKHREAEEAKPMTKKTAAKKAVKKKPVQKKAAGK